MTGSEDRRAPMGDGRRYDHLRLGRHGEQLVARLYERSGFEVADRNWRCAGGEIDLVARRGGLIVFCEVKTRSSTRWGSPLEAVDRRRVQRLRAAAAEYLRTVRPRGVDEVRFDVAAVVGVRVELVEAAF